MSKAILIIDMPKSCYGCDLTYDDSCGMYCSRTKEDVGNYVTGRPEMCPLKPMPEKQKLIGGKIMNENTRIITVEITAISKGNYHRDIVTEAEKRNIARHIKEHLDVDDVVVTTIQDFTRDRVEKNKDKEEWNSVSAGRLPEDDDIYEVTAQFNNGVLHTEFAYYDHDREEWWKHNEDGLVNVIAWREHTSHYQPEVE